MPGIEACTNSATPGWFLPDVGLPVGAAAVLPCPVLPLPQKQQLLPPRLLLMGLLPALLLVCVEPAPNCLSAQ